MKGKLPTGTTILFVLWVVLITLIYTMMSRDEPDIPEDLLGVFRPVPTAVHSLALTDQNGHQFGVEQFRGKWTFLFFGYTYCPDICPNTLTVLASLERTLLTGNETPPEFQVVFVSVDPQRDSPELLKKYVAFFGNDFIGLTGEEEEIGRVAKQFGVMYFKEGDVSTDSYLMAHTSTIFLVSPKANLVASFSPPHDHQTIASQFQAIRDPR